MFRIAQLGSTRLVSLALLFLLILAMGMPATGLAKNPYEMHRTVEGDPGDGVLEPSSQESVDTTDPVGLDAIVSTPPSENRVFVHRFPILLFLNGNPAVPVFVTLPRNLFTASAASGFVPSNVFAGRGW